MNKTYLTILFVLLLSCTSSSNYKKKKIVASLADGNEISIEQVDSCIRYQLYQKLYEIYMLRHTALDELINGHIVESEANKQHLTISQYLSRFVKGDSVNDLSLLIDSLRKKYEVNRRLAAPTPPKIVLTDLHSYFRGNSDSPFTIWEISDLNCEMCKEMRKEYEALYNQYKDKVRFGYIFFSGDVSWEMKVLEVSNQYGKFNEVFSFLTKSTATLDSLQVLDFIVGLGIDKDKFVLQVNNKDTYNTLMYNLEKVYRKGFYSTPNIIVNEQIVQNPSSIKQIQKEIEKQYKQTKLLRK